MARETRDIETVDISQSPELIRLAHEVKHSNHAKSLCAGNEEVGVLMPPRKPRRPRRSRNLTSDDSFWDIVGMSDAREGPTDVSENKHRYLGEVTTPKNA